VAAAVLIAAPLEAYADIGPAERFSSTCAGCHAGGGNIVKREATLGYDDLKKYGLDSPDALYMLIYGGRGSMPGYGEGCAPKGACTFGPRLADGEVQALADYVLEQAKAGWEGSK
jgi:cytochrome c6